MAEKNNAVKGIKGQKINANFDYGLVLDLTIMLRDYNIYTPQLFENDTISALISSDLKSKYMNSKERITVIRQSPLTGKEIDLITATERYMDGILELPLITFSLPCFPNQQEKIVKRIAQVWQCHLAAFHLQSIANNMEDHSTNLILRKAKHIYEQEAQRILGSLFSLEHPFWNTFYKRQESELAKLSLAVDALYAITPNPSTKIPYQLLLQALKFILKAHYLEPKHQRQHYQNAQRLLVELPLTEFHNWLNEQMK